MMNIYLLVFVFLVFTGYVIKVVLDAGVLKSISESFYHLEPKKRWIFTLSMWGFAIPVLIVGDTPLMFFAGAGICFVGAAAAFKGDDMTMKVHVVGAVSGVALSMASLWLDFHMWYFPVSFCICAILLFLTVKNYTWWIEILAFYLVLIALLLVNLR